MRTIIPVRYGKPSNKVFPKAIHPDEGDDHGRRAHCGKTVREHQLLEFQLSETAAWPTIRASRLAVEFGSGLQTKTTDTKEKYYA
jgi:hypothetical protein